jgi:hypothetical protein
MSKWLEKKSIQELKDFISNATKKNSFFKTFKIDVSKKNIRLAKKILEKKELINQYLNEVVLKHGNFIYE